MAMKLNDLKPTPGTKKKRRRVGRGPGAGQGKTAGRGMKGQGARAGGGTPLYHQGGNLPFFRRLPFLRGEGFTPINRIDYEEVNVEKLAGFADGTEVTPDVLAEAKIIRNTRKPIVILGRGELGIALKVHAHRVTKGAKAKIEAAGGSVEIIEIS